MESINVNHHGDYISIDVRGSGFLRNMVRMMVGTLVAVGKGKMPPEAVGRLLKCESGISAGATAPSHGLCLMEVFYGR
jgi:tRNA pseudouridine38-40 synthase